MFRKVIVLLTLMFMPHFASAGAWTGWHKIHIVYAQNNGKVLMALAPDHQHINPDSCAKMGYLILRPENQGFEQIYKMALTAKAAGTNFRVFLSGCDGDYPVIAHSMTY